MAGAGVLLVGWVNSYRVWVRRADVRAGLSGPPAGPATLVTTPSSSLAR